MESLGWVADALEVGKRRTAAFIRNLTVRDTCTQENLPCELVPRTTILRATRQSQRQRWILEGSMSFTAPRAVYRLYSLNRIAGAFCSSTTTVSRTRLRAARLSPVIARFLPDALPHLQIAAVPPLSGSCSYAMYIVYNLKVLR
jgi:hypothetical protein